MSLLIGIIMFFFGGTGAYMTGQYIENDWRYTYAPPLTNHEESVIMIFILCIIVAVVGLVITVFAVWKKRNEDTLQKLTNTTSGGILKNVCPHCGLNIAEGTEVCPRCAKPVTISDRRE